MPKVASGGVVHELPTDLKKLLLINTKSLATWEDITPLARNEWICRIESAKNMIPETTVSNGVYPVWPMANADHTAGLDANIVDGRCSYSILSGQRRRAAQPIIDGATESDFGYRAHRDAAAFLTI